jgi:hypothetical protein
MCTCAIHFSLHRVVIHQIATATSTERFLSYMPLGIDNHNNNQKGVYILSLIDVCIRMIKLKIRKRVDM